MHELFVQSKTGLLMTFNDIIAAPQPGQALLLGKFMSAISSPDMVKEGNFIALMFFVLALGTLVLYFIMGWCVNLIGQVSLQLSSR